MWILISIFVIVVLLLLFGILSILNSSECYYVQNSDLHIRERESLLKKYIDNYPDNDILEDVLKDNKKGDITLSQLYTTQYLLLTDQIKGVDSKEELMMNGKEFGKMTNSRDMHDLNMRLYEYIKERDNVKRWS